MSESLKVMVVDDDCDIRSLLSIILTGMDCKVVQAESGEQALELFRQQLPDMVLIDVVMPGIGGYEAVREMRRIAAEWVPIIFISANAETDDIVHGIEAGGDDYLLKPVNVQILQTKVYALRHRLLLSRQLEKQNKQLLNYYSKNEEEQHTAEEFMQRLLALGKINDPLVQFNLQSAEVFSGDLIAVARTPGNHLHVLLADSTGHGLTAALAVMPIMQTFHAMTAKGYSTSAIAMELNRKVQEYLPVNRFVAAILLSLDVENRQVSIWNGGCPTVLLFDSDGITLHSFHSRYLPLGILKPDAFDAGLEHYNYGDNECQVFMCSDGAVDSADQTDMSQGMSCLLETIRSRETSERMTGMVELLEQKLAGKPAHDDIALILVGCPQHEQAVPTLTHQPEGHHAGGICREAMDAEEHLPDRVEWHYTLSLSAAQLRHIDVVPLLLDVVSHIESDRVNVFSQLFLVLSELFNNALDHGLLKLDSTLKRHPEGMQRYFEERELHLQQLKEGEINISLSRVFTSLGDGLKIVMTDSGEGFDYRSVLDSGLNADTRRHGRGIALVKNLCCELRYLDNGREVHACLPLESSAQG